MKVPLLNCGQLLQSGRSRKCRKDAGRTDRLVRPRWSGSGEGPGDGGPACPRHSQVYSHSKVEGYQVNEHGAPEIVN